jgi:hypothetical protein
MFRHCVVIVKHRAKPAGVVTGPIGIVVAGCGRAGRAALPHVHRRARTDRVVDRAARAWRVWLDMSSRDR